MHRIDVPSATVDHMFTEGSPSGGVPATVVSDDWLNDVQENIMAVLEASGITPTKGRAADLLDSIRGLGVGQSGFPLNSRMSVPVVSASATWTADLVTVAGAGGKGSYSLSGFGNLPVNLAATGPGGMDTGAAPANGYVALYVIYNPDTKAVALLAADATSVLAPEFYAGANMPAGFKASALVSVWPTTAGRLFQVASQMGRKLSIQAKIVASSTTPVATTTTYATLGIAGTVPLNAKNISGFNRIFSNNGTNAALNIAGGPTGVGVQQLAGSVPGGSATGFVGAFAQIPILTPQTTYWSATIGTGTLVLAEVNISSYEI